MSIEEYTLNYWKVSSAQNGVVPKTLRITDGIPTSYSLNVLNVSTALRLLTIAEGSLNPQRLLAKLIHELKFDIIEGNTKWRTPNKVSNGKKSFTLILFTAR